MIAFSNGISCEEIICKLSRHSDFGNSCRLENVLIDSQTNHSDIKIKSVDNQHVFFVDSTIKYLSTDFLKQLKYMEYFNANGIGLEKIDRNSLKVFNLLYGFWGGQNKLKKLEAKTFIDNPSLELLYLKFNRIEYVSSHAFLGLDNLMVMDLSSNRIKTIQNGTFHNLYKLIKLDISSNSIEYLQEDTFEHLQSLRQLIIAKNNFKTINPHTFDPLVNLEYFNLSFNKSPIEFIEGRLFKQNKKLNQVFLISNKIRSIDPQFFYNKKVKLTRISLRSNKCINDDVEPVDGKLNHDFNRQLEQCFMNFKNQ